MVSDKPSDCDSLQISSGSNWSKKEFSLSKSCYLLKMISSVVAKSVPSGSARLKQLLFKYSFLKVKWTYSDIIPNKSVSKTTWLSFLVIIALLNLKIWL